MIIIFIYIVGAHGLNLLTGYTGQISLGHGAFMGVGAYAAGILANAGYLPFWLCLPAAGLITAAVGMIFGIPSLRLQGPVPGHRHHGRPVHPGLRHAQLVGAHRRLQRPDGALGHTVRHGFRRRIQLLLPEPVLRGRGHHVLEEHYPNRTGRAFVAVRDRYLAAEVIGVDLFKYRLLSFGISSFMVGIAGGLWAYYISIISDEHFTMWLSVQFLAMVIVGRHGARAGSIFGWCSWWPCRSCCASPPRP